MSVLASLLDVLISHLNQIMNDSNRHETIIVSAAKLMSLVGRLFTRDIVNSEPLANTYLNVAKTVLAKIKYN